MVLYRGKPFQLPAPKALTASLNVPVWTIDQTGEWYTDYNEYAQRMAFYKSPVFETELSSRTNVSYFDACLDESQNLQYIVENLPEYLWIPLGKFIYSLNELNLDTIAKAVIEYLGREFFVGEQVLMIQSPTRVDNLVDKIFTIREKAVFKPVMDESGKEVLIPGYSRYMICADVDSQASSSQGRMKLNKYIVDQSQIKRIKSIPTEYLIGRFCKLLYCSESSDLINITLKESNLALYLLIHDWNMANTKEGVMMNHPKLILNEPKSTVEDGEKEQEQEPSTTTVNNNINNPDKRSAQEDDDLVSSNTFDNIINKKPRLSNQDNSQDPSLQFQKSADLNLPFQGALDRLHFFHYYNDNLEYLPYTSKSTILSDSNTTGKLLEIYHFLISFSKVLELSPFNWDDLITSLKCTDPHELSGEIVNITLNDKDTEISKNLQENDMNDPSHDKQFSQWERNSKIRKLITTKSTDLIHYSILQNFPITNEKLLSVENNGANLIIEVFMSLLSMIINERGDWRCDIAEEWFDDKENEAMMDDTPDEVNTILNYRNVNWAERLAKRQFKNGFWVIILLGVLQDSMHISKYTEIATNFTKKVIPEKMLATSLNKQMYEGFCSNLTLAEKVDILWALVDIISNYSIDIKIWIDVTQTVTQKLQSEKSRIARLKLLRSSTLTATSIQLEQLKKNYHPENFLVVEKQKEMDTLKDEITKLVNDENLLDSKILEYTSSRLFPVGTDKYGNVFFFFESNAALQFKDSSSKDSSTGNDNNPDVYYSGRLWICGPARHRLKGIFNITDQQIDDWQKIASEDGKVEATKKVFGVYRDEKGAYFQTENEIDIEFLNSKGEITPNFPITPLQRKIVDETPERLLFSDNEWYCTDDISDIRRLLFRLDPAGIKEDILCNNIKCSIPKLQKSINFREIINGTERLDIVEEKLLNEFEKYEYQQDELRQYINDDSNKENKTDTNILISSEELEDIARKVVTLHDTQLTRKILGRIKVLESQRSANIEKQMNQLSFESLGLRMNTFLQNSHMNVITNKKLRKQMDILTDLLNYKHFKYIKNVSRWENKLRRYNPTGYNKDNGYKFIDVNARIESEWQDIEKSITPPQMPPQSYEQPQPQPPTMETTRNNEKPPDSTAQGQAHQDAQVAQHSKPQSQSQSHADANVIAKQPLNPQPVWNSGKGNPFRTISFPHPQNNSNSA